MDRMIEFVNAYLAYDRIGVGQSYRRAIFDEVNFNVEKDEFVTIVGRSGCGKTTILNAIAGLLKPMAGSVIVDGRDAETARGITGYMFARDCLLPWRTVAGNISFGLEAKHLEKNERKLRIERELSRVNLSMYRSYYPSELSQGMRQRVAIARTLALDPRILLMDEPFAALDAQTRVEIEEQFLGEWDRDPRTVVMVTHDLTEALFLGDRVVVIKDGTISMDLRPGLSRPRVFAETTTTLEFVSAVRELRRAL